MPDRLLDVLRGGVEVIDLARPMVAGMPQSPNHPEYRHTLPRRHGDMVRADGGSAANDLVVLGGHVGTHIDALCHVSHLGRLHGGHDAAEAQTGGRFSVLGVETVPPGLLRGVLLDVPRMRGVEGLEGGDEITPADLERTLELEGVHLEAGDAVLVRSGWGRHWGDRVTYVGTATGVPGCGEEGARWLARHRPFLCGADTIAFERLLPGAGHALLPAHRVLLVEEGIHIVETLDLEALAARGVYEFTFVLAPLPLVGATGSPFRPLALVAP